MNFASYEFWKLLILCFLASRVIMGIAKAISPELESLFGKLCLAATGLILLGAESWLTLGVFLWVVGLSWIGVLIASRDGFEKSSIPGKLIFAVLLVGQLAPLFYYKYWTFVLNDLLGLAVKVPSVFIPIGLSFYTFQKIGFWIDTIRNPGSRPRFLDYLNFCSFFPQIVAGPIEKRAALLPQIEEFVYKIRPANIPASAQWIVLGLAYKMVVADNLGLYPGKFHIDPSNPFHVWLEVFTFSIRIYFDFAGYSFIAVGLALIFGIRLTLNFRSPYWSANLREYWRNWHVTLGAWLRDYIYIPLGGNKNGRGIINILIVFLVSGIWHGAGWGFIIWGLLHGVGLTLCSSAKEKKTPWAIRWLVTFTFITATRLYFMETNTDLLIEKSCGFLNPLSYNLTNLRSLPAAFSGPLDIISLMLIFAIATIALLAEGLGIRKNKEPYHYGRLRIITFLLVFLIVFLAPMEESRFIYFNF
ncbi:MAG: MBOAT family protein [Armatimonadetes bacterium]|nr:MBOAT family protein [Akkermansiaceae bacterium]